MIVGVPKEIKDNEKRVSLTPSGALELINAGHTVYIEKDAGIGSGFDDDMYTSVGAISIDSPVELFSKSELILKVKEPQREEISRLTPKHTLFTFFHSFWDLWMPCWRF